MRSIMHIDFNSYFASVEQQANPRLRGKPIGVTGGDRMKRTVLGAASIEAKRFGVKTGMQIWEARKLCPQIILVPGDSDKYLETTKRFLNILKDYSPYLEVFSIDECFLELKGSEINSEILRLTPQDDKSVILSEAKNLSRMRVISIAQDIKKRIKQEIGEWITCSIGISYNKLMAKLAGSLKKPDGLIIISTQEEAIKILDQIELDTICGIGPRIKKRLNNLGISNFYQLRQAPLESLLAAFKSYGQTLYNMARGIDNSTIVPFYTKGEVKSIGHRHTIDHDTADLTEIKQILLKLSEMVARRLRAKTLVGKTIHCWYREAFSVHLEGDPMVTPGAHLRGGALPGEGSGFQGDGMQTTIPFTNDGLEIFQAAWKIFHQIWNQEAIRMIGISISNLTSQIPQNLSFLPEVKRKEIIIKTLDKINDKYGEFTLQRGILLTSAKIRRKPNPFLSDRRFKL
ncbi:MAG: DNA polymerase IV [Candidatus Daviesbacteria bacterium]|nr:DNA polymerase IV [Candidatus Daviesbacteria bacterium]